MKQHEALSDALAALGVPVVFGLVGDANLFQIDDWVRRYGGRYVSVAHENAAVLAAGGYASVTDEVGIASITHGPALTNTVTALVDLVRAGLPVVVIAGSTDPADPGHLQYVDQSALVLATGARYERAVVPDRIGADLARSIRLARAERRPVVLDVPAQHQWLDVGEAVAPRALTPSPVVHPDPASVEDAVGVLASARRPVLVAGRGARHARDELERLAARLGAPVATSVRGKGLFDAHPHDLGIMGTLSHEVASEVLAEADVVVAFGASLNGFTTASGGWLGGKRVVQVDDRAVALGRWSTPDVAVLGDAAVVAGAMTALLEEADVPPTAFASPGLATRLATQRAAEPAPPVAGGDTVPTLRALRRVDELVPADRVLVIDDGRFMLSAFTAVGVRRPGDYVHGACFASIGLSLGYAVGAAAAAPDRTVLVVTGDGGFVNGGLAEFSSAVRHQMRVVVVVMNDGAYGAEHMQFTARDLDPSISCLDWPDLAPVAAALGGTGHTARTEDELVRALREPGAGPVLIDVRLDPDEVPGTR